MNSNENNLRQAKLFLLPTPIGNLGDISLRTLETLKSVDAIYCEDTRNTLKLLNYYEIRKPVYSCHEHNEEQKAAEIAGHVINGKSIAFVSDAGMPAVSDPGERLIRYFIRNDLPFEVFPGANAALMAWVMSGFSTKKLFFCGFLPRSGAERTESIEELRRQSAVCVVYESPMRVGATLAELYQRLGNRPCAVVRELTKLHEEAVRGNLLVLSEKYAQTPPKGECVIVIGPAENNVAENSDTEKLKNVLKQLLSAGVRAKDAAKIASYALNSSKNEAYRVAIELGEEY